MQDIRFVSGDGEALILETAEGEKYRLPVDTTVRDAIRQQPGATSQNSLSPREIQDAIRSGTSVEELVSASGDSIDFVTRFAAPVLEELAHMVASALAVRVEIEPDRFNEIRHREFGDLMTERLRNGGASKIEWKASRLTPFTWTISADFETMGGVGIATWTFDPRHVVLSPENETAVGLSNSTGFGNSPIPKLQVIPTAAPKVEAPVEAPTEETKVTELLDAFKQRREAVAAEVAPEVEATEVVEAVELDEVPETAPEPAIEQPKAEQPRKGRAPMPSWDEIVFGSKSDE